MHMDNSKGELIYWNDINKQQAKAWSSIDRLLVMCKSDLSDKIKRFFPSSSRVHTTEWVHLMDVG